MNAAATLHASALVIEGKGVLIRGASGSGKSSLLLSLLYFEAGRAQLVADDRVVVSTAGRRLTARPPVELAGRIEVRGQGIFDRPYAATGPVDLVVDLLPAEDCVRFPEPAERTVTLHGIAVARIFVVSGSGDGPARVAFALARLGG